jgi:hypothetical protein
MERSLLCYFCKKPLNKSQSNEACYKKEILMCAECGDISTIYEGDGDNVPLPYPPQ